MRRTGKSICLPAALCVIAVLASAALAQDDVGSVTAGISTNLDLAYVSKYVWRGIPVNSDPSVQPSLTITHPGGLSFNFWGSMDTTGIAGKSGDFTEIDYTLNYSWTAKNLEMNAGIVSYTFPNTSFDSTTEVYASVCPGGNYSPSLALNYDFDEANGLYASLGAGYTCPLPWNKKAPSMGIAAKVSWAASSYNKFYYNGADKSAFTDALITASTPITVSPKVTVTPIVSYSRTLDGDIRDAMAGAGLDEDNFFAGLTVSSSF